MLILFLLNFYLGVGVSEYKGQTFPNNYNVNISTQLKENRILYALNREIYECPYCGYEDNRQDYSFISNMVFVKDKHFTGIQNSCDISELGIFREDIDVGLHLKSGNTKHYLTGGLSFEKYKDYKPCVRYGLIYTSSPKIAIPVFKDNINFLKSALNACISITNGILSVGYKWTYETRANVLYAYPGRYEYSIETATRLYILKNFGWEASGCYNKYNNVDNHFCSWKSFLDF
ncbi:MAG: hypothetical protein PHX21_13060 [bacterium]|nr:hypothetical protein [bacterium]